MYTAITGTCGNARKKYLNMTRPTEHTLLSLVELAASLSEMTTSSFLRNTDITLSDLKKISEDESQFINLHTADRLINIIQQSFQLANENDPNKDLPTPASVKKIVYSHHKKTPPQEAVKGKKIYKGLIAYNAARKRGELDV